MLYHTDLVFYIFIWASLVAQMVKNLPAMQETWVRSLGQEKVDLKLSIQKPKIITSSPITSLQIDGEKLKQWQISFSWAPKSLRMVTAAMKLKDTCFLKESYDKPRQCFKKQRPHFADKGLCSQSCDFPGIMYGCESLTTKKTERRRADAFERWCWRRLLRVRWTPKR